MATARANTKWGLLAYLRWQTSYGYQLTQAFSRAFPSWEVSDQAIYSALKALKRAGWIEVDRVVVVSAGCSRTSYRVTPEGERQLEQFLGALDLLDVPSQYFDIAIRVASWAGPDAMFKLLDDLETYANECLDHLTRPAAPTRVHELGDWSFWNKQQHDLYGVLGWIEDTRQATVALVRDAGGGP